MKLEDIREFFWPLLEPKPPSDSSKVEEEDIKITNEENIEIAYDWAIKSYEREEKRRSDVEGKSTIFIGTVGFLITILLSITKDLFAASEPFFLNVIAFSVIIIYLCRVAWFAIKALQRNGYHGISPKALISEDGNFKKILIAKLINYSNENSKTINLKVDYMTMAQEYFKRAIICVALYSGVLVLYSAYFCKYLNISMNGVYLEETIMRYEFILNLGIFVGVFLLVWYKNKSRVNLMKNLMNCYVERPSIWFKITCALVFVVVVYGFYIATLVSVLNIMEMIVTDNAELLKQVGFLVVVSTSVVITMKLFDLFKGELVLLEKHFRLLSDFMTVLLPIIAMYQFYYVSDNKTDPTQFDLIVLMLSNKELLGIPFIILLVRLIATFHVLTKNKENK